jgi:agmatine deiminase
MTQIHTSTPLDDGCRMPAEFGPHRGCWMLWPERGDTWRMGATAGPGRLRQGGRGHLRLRAGHGWRPAGNQWENARALLPDGVRVVEISSDDAWMRDVGPTFVVNDHGVPLVGSTGSSMPGEAWTAASTSPGIRDSLVAAKVLEIERADRYRAPLVMEGGSFHVDGQGTLITTGECLLNRNRNPHLTQNEIDACLKSLPERSQR